MRDAVLLRMRIPIELSDSVYKDVQSKFLAMWIPFKSIDYYFLPDMETEQEKVVCLEIKSSDFRTALHYSLSASKYFSLLEVALTRYRAGELNWELVRIDEKDDDWYLYEGEMEYSFLSLFPLRS